MGEDLFRSVDLDRRPPRTRWFPTRLQERGRRGLHVYRLLFLLVPWWGASPLGGSVSGIINWECIDKKDWNSRRPELKHNDPLNFQSQRDTSSIFEKSAGHCVSVLGSALCRTRHKFGFLINNPRDGLHGHVGFQRVFKKGVDGVCMRMCMVLARCTREFLGHASGQATHFPEGHAAGHATHGEFCLQGRDYGYQATARASGT